MVRMIWVMVWIGLLLAPVLMWALTSDHPNAEIEDRTSGRVDLHAVHEGVTTSNPLGHPSYEGEFGTSHNMHSDESPKASQNAKQGASLSTTDIRLRDSLLIGNRLLLLLLLTLLVVGLQAALRNQKMTPHQWVWLLTTSALFGCAARILENQIKISYAGPQLTAHGESLPCLIPLAHDSRPRT